MIVSKISTGDLIGRQFSIPHNTLGDWLCFIQFVVKVRNFQIFLMSLSPRFSV